MENTSAYPFSISKIQTVIFDLIALLTIYLVPSISHLLSLPVYYIEPMRIILILALVHTSQKNAYMIAATLPLFSMLISYHPSLIKTSLITGELLLNVWLYFFLSEKLSNKTLSIFLSIILGKLFYYLIKILLINSAAIGDDIISTPIYFQITIIFVLSTYVYLVTRQKVI